MMCGVWFKAEYYWTIIIISQLEWKWVIKYIETREERKLEGKIF